MARVARKVKDKRVLKLMRNLTSGYAIGSDASSGDNGSSHEHGSGT
jgi:hypothetical protein